MPATADLERVLQAILHTPHMDESTINAMADLLVDCSREQRIFAIRKMAASCQAWTQHVRDNSKRGGLAIAERLHAENNEESAAKIAAVLRDRLGNRLLHGIQPERHYMIYLEEDSRLVQIPIAGMREYVELSATLHIRPMDGGAVNIKKV